MTVAFNEPRYQIEASDFRCHACGSEIPCEAVYFSAVSFEESAFRRKNYCASCWARLVSSLELFAFWRTRRPGLPSDKPRRARLDPAIIYEFFRRLGEDLAKTEDSPEAAEKEDLRFVLALLLIRKKALDFVSSQARDGVEWLKLEVKQPPARARMAGAEPDAGPPEGGEASPQPPPAEKVHWVKNPNLSGAELERVKVRIGDLLQLEI